MEALVLRTITDGFLFYANALDATTKATGGAMIEPDFLAKACAREEADEQAALYDEIYKGVAAEREAQDLPPAPIMVAAEAGRRLRLELSKHKK